ncbi:IS256 family transposase [Streptococcus agalactiae]|nr:IS256 family transposase [Streptococcus agalactiae]
MTQFTTELLNFLAQKQDIDEFFRSSLETAMNDLLQVELSAFLGYEPYDKAGYNTVIVVMVLIHVDLRPSMVLLIC